MGIVKGKRSAIRDLFWCDATADCHVPTPRVSCRTHLDIINSYFTSLQDIDDAFPVFVLDPSST